MATRQRIHPIGEEKMTTIDTNKLMELLPRLNDYVALVTELNADYWTRNGFTFAPAPVASVSIGRRYAKIIKEEGSHNCSVHTFVDMTNGNILKAGSWKAPAPNGVRGNIFSDDLGRSVINEHGANYII